jgi:hypothetical protein
MAKLEDRLAALAALSLAQLRGQWLQLFKNEAPAVSMQFLIRAVAHRIQENELGKLKSSECKELDRLAAELGRTGSISPSSASMIKPGTRLVRSWHGEDYHVLIREDGFLYIDKLYPSLSQIAKLITGTSWSGPRFFGLKAGKDGNG